MGAQGHPERRLEGSGVEGWQVKTAGGAVLADNGAWHAFTVSTAALFSKQAPANGASGLGPALTLQWTPVPNEGYWICWDTSDNNTCDTMWWPSPIPTQAVSNLSAGTYYWQVKTAGGGIPADNGAWHAPTVSTTALFTKQAPARFAIATHKYIPANMRALQRGKAAVHSLTQLLGGEPGKPALDHVGPRAVRLGEVRMVPCMPAGGHVLAPVVHSALS